MSILINIEASKIVSLAQEAGALIMEVYHKDFAIYSKDDGSPLTEADTVSHQVILSGLRVLTPEFPVLSEESNEKDVKGRLNWETYWLIDPLDGTKEFVKKNGEFTVNIALIHKNKVILGVVDAPALGVTYWGGESIGAYKLEDGVEKSIQVINRKENAENIKIVGSRSHQSKEFLKFIKGYSNASIVSMGSSLKLCLVAEGLADLYPRLGLTSEWDTAAAQAIVEGAGGSVVSLYDNLPLRYNMNKNTLLNPYFLASN